MSIIRGHPATAMASFVAPSTFLKTLVLVLFLALAGSATAERAGPKLPAQSPYWGRQSLKQNLAPLYKESAAAVADPFGWKPCPHSKDDRWKCGSITVPFDYKNASEKRTMKIETVLFQAGKTKANHTIVINPGGPGGSGVAYAWSAAEKISSNYTDSTFDVLGFDPRGVNASEPSISCYPNDGFRDRWVLLGNYYKEKGDKATDLELWDASSEAQFKACREKYGDIPAYLTTALVARDMDTIRAALGEDKLYYYGVSYGTGLGSTYTQMFPDRVGRMLLDALEYIPEERTTTGFGTAALHDIIRAFNDGFIGECIRAGPAGCALAAKPNTKETDTVAGLQARFETIFSSLIKRPAVASHPDVGPGFVRYKDVIDFLYSAMYNSAGWPRLAKAISNYESSANATDLLLRLEDSDFSADPTKCPEPGARMTGDAGIFVICGDQYDAPHPDLNWYLDLWGQMSNRSFIGGDGRFLDILPCRHFDWTPAEVYRGDLHANLSNPILLIAETYDPATPLVNGKKLYADMGPSNAHLVIHHGYGHSSRDRSNCTEAIKRNYFITGKLPEGPDPTDCYADTKPYPVDAVQKQAAFGADLSELAPATAEWGLRGKPRDW